MTRQQRADDELRAASSHLYYEIWMFYSVARGLASGITGQGVLTNALLESFTLHSRVLLDFFYSDKPRSDDMIASDFLEAPSQWQSHRPPMSESLSLVDGRVGKEVAHLTYARLSVKPDDKPWAFLEIANDLSIVVDKFLTLVPAQRLGPEWDGYLQMRASVGA